MGKWKTRHEVRKLVWLLVFLPAEYQALHLDVDMQDVVVTLQYPLRHCIALYSQYIGSSSGSSFTEGQGDLRSPSLLCPCVMNCRHLGRYH